MYITDFRQFGSNLKRTLESRGMTQSEFADALGVSSLVVDQIIKGSKAINVTGIAKISSVLGVSADTLLVSDSARSGCRGLTQSEEVQNKLEVIRSAIDDIHFLNEILGY